MNYLIKNSLVGYLNHHSENEFFWVSLFRRSLYGFLLLKILLSTSILSEIVLYQPLLLTSKVSWIGYAPLLLLSLDLYFFLGLFMFLLWIGIVKSNGIISFLILWFSICLSRLMLPIINGSDFVLNLFLLFSIFMSHNRDLAASLIARIVSNTSLLIAQIQLALIYFLSGYDKLLSEAWRSGAAVFSILRLEFFQNPYFVFDPSPALCGVLGWAIIVFEVGFAVLIWFKFFRIPLLITGVFFHLSIILFLGLLDFGLLMIVCYTIFLPGAGAKEVWESRSKSIRK